MTTTQTNPERFGNSIATYTGRWFWPLDPRPEDIVIEDIAHALSNKCRFSGHTKKFYCVTPETKILKSTLEWVPAKELLLGDSLLAFDEFPDLSQKRVRARRKLCHSTVKHNGIIIRPTYQLTLSNGQKLTCSEEHPWLVSTKKSKNQKWIKTKDIFDSVVNKKQKRYLLKFLSPWEKDMSYNGAYLAGFFDGEGHVSGSSGGVSVGAAQKENVVLNKVIEILQEKKINFSCRKNTRSNVMNLTIQGGWHKNLEFIGKFGPLRLAQKIKDQIEQNNFRIEFPSIEQLEIVDVNFLGNQEVIALETSSHTYFAEGFGAHNSVAQHSVIVSLICDPKDFLWGLLHDASEAYLVDMPKPLKILPEFEWFRKAEDKVQLAVCKRFNLSLEQPESTHVADKVALLTEKRDLMAEISHGRKWEENYNLSPLEQRIIAMQPEEARDYFLKRYYELTSKP